MASLKKPKSCKCGSTDLHREHSPERWVCKCGEIVRSRKKKPNSNTCRECGALRESKEFKPGKNLCLECARMIHKEWSDKNRERLRAKSRTPEERKRRQKAVKKAVQKSPESFLRNLLTRITKPSYNKRRLNNRKGAIFNVEVDHDFLVDLWYKQSGLCAITGVKMKHKHHDLRTISIDRIDSDLGYIPRNVQLVCQAINHAKRHHTQESFLKFVEEIRTAEPQKQF